MTDFVRPHYENAPIAEALIDIRIANPDAVTLDQLTRVADALVGEFPVRHPIQQLVFGYQVAPNADAGFVNNQEQIGWRLHSSSQNRVLQLQRMGFTFSHLPPYTNWNSFRDEARRHWKVFQAVVEAPAFNRAAVRVINKIPTPSAEVALQDYLLVYPVVPDELPATADAVFFQLQMGMPKILPDARAILNVASGRADENGSHLLLDIDLFANRLVERDDEVWSILEKFGVEKDVIFEACITEKIRKAIQ